MLTSAAQEASFWRETEARIMKAALNAAQATLREAESSCTLAERWEKTTAEGGSQILRGLDSKDRARVSQGGGCGRDERGGYSGPSSRGGRRRTHWGQAPLGRECASTTTGAGAPYFSGVPAAVTAGTYCTAA